MYLSTSGTTNGTMPSAARCSAARSTQPVPQEVRDIEEERGGRREDGDVAGPAEPLVALRAVGRHVEEVAAQAPDDVAVQLVEQLVGALELADPPQVGVRPRRRRGIRR